MSHLTSFNAGQSVRIAIGSPYAGKVGNVVSYGSHTAMVRVASVTLPYSFSELRQCR
jgi:hypothetical protein